MVRKDNSTKEQKEYAKEIHKKWFDSMVVSDNDKYGVIHQEFWEGMINNLDFIEYMEDHGWKFHSIMHNNFMHKIGWFTYEPVNITELLFTKIEEK